MWCYFTLYTHTHTHTLTNQQLSEERKDSNIQENGSQYKKVIFKIFNEVHSYLGLKKHKPLKHFLFSLLLCGTFKLHPELNKCYLKHTEKIECCIFSWLLMGERQCMRPSFF